IPMLGPLSDLLNKKLPIVDKSVGSLLGVKDPLAGLNSASVQSDAVRATAGGPGLKVELGPGDINDLIRGNPVDLISLQDAGGSSFRPDVPAIPLFSLGIPKVVSLDASLKIQPKLDWNWGVRAALDTEGIYLDVRRPNPKIPESKDNPRRTRVEVSGTIDGTLKGSAEVLGFDVASVSGGAGFTLTGGVKPYDEDGDGKVYLGEIWRPGENVVDAFTDALNFSLRGDLTLHAAVDVDVLLFSYHDDWQKTMNVFRFERQPRPR